MCACPRVSVTTNHQAYANGHTGNAADAVTQNVTTRQCRECFLDILCEESGDFLEEEAAEVRVPTWEESKRAWRDVPIALMHLRRAAGGDTVGVKLRQRE